ncbi:PEP-CTERM system TPR-repeat protein PrsT [Catenovulum sp. SM1970]|uniref:XrtA/PEP-CTERM system TPR-repeat protein PrsT n=1 Tax=Marinifaba aquimaris TaxID=2741323 RepID=UPI001573E47C|nr:XrtA/PEP-CTERM system TPR-repeat protein PrsT [Marinifaba aquimaris]NTS77746.1 PEP-CTERM system TPR-repeat protein PrsT [Marinifaba aquimaris]
MNKYGKSLIAATLLSSILACGEKSFEEHLSAAKNHLAGNEIKAAEIELKNAIRKNNRDFEARTLLAKLYYEQGFMARAEKEFKAAYNLSPNDQTVIDYLVRSHYLAQNYSALIQLQEIHPENRLAQYYSAVIDLKEFRLQEAIDRFTKLSETMPDEYSLLSQAYLAIEKTEFAEAEKRVLTVLSDNPNNIDALLLKGQLGVLPEKQSLAIEAYTVLRDSYPKYVPFTMYLASSLVKDQDFSQAEPLIDSLVKTNPNNALVNQLYAQVLFRKSEFEDAKRFSEKAIHSGLDSHLNRITAGISSYKVSNFEQAYKHLMNVHTVIKPDHVINNILIDLQMRLGYEDEAMVSINRLSEAGQLDSSFLLDASNQMLASGETDKAKALFDSAQLLSQNSSADLFKQAVIQLKMNEGEAGIASLEKLLEQDADFSAAEEILAASYLAKSDFNAALGIANKWQSGDKLVKGLLLEASIMMRQDKLEKAKELSAKVLESEPDNLSAKLKIALVEFKKSNFDAAFKLFTEALKISPAQKTALSHVVDISAQDKRYKDQVFAILTEEKFSNSVPHQQALSTFYLAHGEKAKAISVMEKLSQADNAPDHIQYSLSALYYRNGDYQKAIDLLETYLTKYSRNLAATKDLLVLYQLTGQFNEALAQVNRTLRTFPQNVGLRLHRTYFQAMIGEEAFKDDVAFLNKQSALLNSDLYHRTMGMIHSNDDNPTSAMLSFSKAYEIAPTKVNTINYAKLSIRQGIELQAIEVLDTYYQKDQSSVQINSLLADANYRQGNTDVAKKLYQELIKMSSRHFVAYNNLASINLEDGDAKQALDYAVKATELNAKNPYLLDTYAKALLANGKVEQGLKAYDKALAIAPNNFSISVNKVKSLLELNRKNEAVAVVEAFDKPTNEQKAEFDKLLKQI